MSLLTFDHLALSAQTLDAGRDHVERALGVTLDTRGEHPQMGTHNRLLSLGSDTYFEVIAVNPEAPAPQRPRWFNIDNFAGAPRLTNWILATTDMDAALAELPDGFGTLMSLQRGAFRWRMAVPDNGILPWNGWAPALIQWASDIHPAPGLPDQDIRLTNLQLRHPQAQDMAELLAPLLPRDTALFEPSETAEMVATFSTPTGEKTLR